MNTALFSHLSSIVPEKQGGIFTYKAMCGFLLAIFFCQINFAQDTIKNSIEIRGKKTVTPTPAFQPDSLLVYPYNKKRVIFMASANIVGYSAALVALNAAWYKDYPQSKFHVFNDFPEWDQMDKIGHAYSAYAESKISMELWRWTGIERKKRIWLGGMSGFFYQTVIEVLDGYSSAWGWSWGDIGANFLGSTMLVAQELAWDEQRIQFKWSFHKKTYDDPTLNVRSDKIFGTSDPERYLKDYNGQTYWLSTNLRSFFPHSKIPRWFSVAIGTGAEGFFGARANIGIDKDGNIDFYRPDIKRYRQWYLAPDIDLTKIRTKKRGVRMALSILNIVKFPMPSLEYSNGSMKFNWIHF